LNGKKLLFKVKAVIVTANVTVWAVINNSMVIKCTKSVVLMLLPIRHLKKLPRVNVNFKICFNRLFNLGTK